MENESQPSRRLWILVLAVAIAVLSVHAIHSYDYFWHLATGRWIAEHRALPLTDPFSVGSDRTEWINGEWLFQLALFAAHRLVGDAGLSVVRAIAVAALFGWIAWLIRNREPAVVVALVTVSWVGADVRLDARPEAVGALLLVVALALLLLASPSRLAVAAYTALAIVWMNVHPSALLAPLLAAAVAGVELLDRRERRAVWRMHALAAALSAAALLVNPFGATGVASPLRLARWVESGAFTNREWTPSDPRIFPLLWIAVLLGSFFFVRGGSWRREAPRALLFAFFALLAIRYVRNQAFFFCTLPLFLAPVIPELRSKKAGAVAIALSLVLAFAVWPSHGGMAFGANPEMFPLRSLDQLAATRFEGNIYNADQFGGCIIWRFYPERRALTDGRNELYHTLLPEIDRALVDSRAWDHLISKYRLVLAVDEFESKPIEVTVEATGERIRLAPSLVYFPRTRWALIGFDDVSMVLARRDAFSPAAIARLEYHALVPDAPDPIVDRTPDGIERARAEIARARSILGECRIVRFLERRLGGL